MEVTAPAGHPASTGEPNSHLNVFRAMAHLPAPLLIFWGQFPRAVPQVLTNSYNQDCPYDVGLAYFANVSCFSRFLVFA